MRSLVLIRDLRRRLPLPTYPPDAPATSASGSTSTTALTIDPVHGTGFLLLGWEGTLVACDPEEEGVAVWTADLNAAVAEEEGPGPDGAGPVRGWMHTHGSIDRFRGPMYTYRSPYIHLPSQTKITQSEGQEEEWLAAFHLGESEAVLCVARGGALVLVDCATGDASLAGIVGPGGVLAASLAPDEELLVFLTGAGVLLGMTPGLEVLYEVRFCVFLYLY